ncbi:MAG TPA: DUF4838 domain-containing protein [Candidatus Hydrogenedentes bacterium]|nr:DUF4838 domain-containing protein [Candidatus Hydrogenedentota bacterium]
MRTPTRAFAACLAAALPLAALLTGCETLPMPKMILPGPETPTPVPAMTLAEGGAAKAAIVVPANAPPSTLYAAEELQRFLGEMTGASFEVIPDTAPQRASEIVLGRSARLERLGVSIDFPALGNEGYVLVTKGSHLVIAGGEPRGTLYGVYGLLEDHLGCRWFTPEVSHIPRAETLAVSKLDEVRIPVLEYREPFVSDCFDGDWAARNRANGNTARLTEKHGGKVIYRGFVHTFDQLVPPEKYFDEHPEYFSLIDGARRKERTQLCCTNEDVVRIVTEEVRRWMRESPDATVFSVSQNDWYNYCQCGKCTALAEAEGSQIAPVLQLVNSVARTVRDEFPDKVVDTLAYQYTRKPPKTMRPEPNVIIRLCSIECDFSHPFDERATKENAAFADDLNEWAKVANRLWVWNYNTSFSNYLTPFPNLKVRGPNIRYMIANNVRGIFEQDVYNTPHGEFSGLSGYVGAKLLWNPDYDTDKAVNEFLLGVYGDAAAPLRLYLDLIHEAVADPKTNMGIWIGPDVKWLTDDLLKRADELMDMAEKAVADQPEVLERVKIARLSTDFAIIERMRARATDAYAFDHKKSMVTMRPEFKARVDRFFSVAERNGLTTIRESGGELGEYKKMILDSFSGEKVYELQKAAQAGKVTPGLKWAYYNKTLNDLPDFSTLTPDATGVANRVDISKSPTKDGFALRFEGFLKAPENGLYSLALRSNDGSRLYLGGELLIDNGGLHKAETKTAFAALEKGLHPVVVEYFESGGEETLSLFWSGPGVKHAAVPGDAFAHAE